MLLKGFIRKLIPNWLISLYHLNLAFLGAVFYGFPSTRLRQRFGGRGKLKVIGVTGTKGKTTVCNLIAQILEYCGYRVGLTTTVNFQIADKKWVNDKKQTMLGRFGLQKLLAQMVKAGCQYAVVETSSEGILQHRHRFIDYDVAVFTNLSPEHIERHGSFEKYREAKLKLFKKVARKKNGVGVYNLDDENVGHFLKVPVEKKWGYGSKIFNFPDLVPTRSRTGQFLIFNKFSISNFQKIIAKNIKASTKDIKFFIKDIEFAVPLLGEFNAYNSLAAICVALSQGVDLGKVKEALAQARPIPGRMESIDEGQDFTVIVDYAHEPASLEAAYKAVQLFGPKRIIALLGSQGGGRDKAKRPILGELASRYADYIILANEDPYDENPEQILKDVRAGVLGDKFSHTKIILDRREAIRETLFLAQAGDAVILTGKGGEKSMCVAGGKKILWDEAEVVREELRKLA